MDLLSQYKQDHPEAFREKKPALLTDEYGRTHSGMVALVMWLSGGRIRDARQAGYAMLAIAAVAVAMALVLLEKNFNLFPAPRFSANDARKQLEEYRKIQPF